MVDASLSSSSSHTSSLVQQLRASDERAWRRLIDLYSPLVYSWCRQAGLPAQDSADVMQEVFMAVSRAVSRYNHNSSNSTFRGWLWTITRNKVLDHFRKGSRQVAGTGGTDAHIQMAQLPEDLSELTDSSQSDDSYSTNLFFQGLEHVKREFRPQTWKAFWMVVVEGFSTAEVGEQMGISANGVRQAKSRVLRRLREMLGDAPA